MSRKKKLIWQLYPSFLAIALIALAAALLYFSHTFRRFYYQQMRNELRTLAGVAAPQVARTLADARPGEPNELCQRLAEAAGGQVRFTIITPAGKVRGDSHEDPAVMEDHSNRPEIINALRKGFGQSVRFSPTLGKRMMYVALPIRSDSEPQAVVRVAVAVTAIDQVIDEMHAHILWAGLAIVAGLALLSLLISRTISRPVVTMRRTAQLFAKGQFNARVPAADVAELDDLAGALNEMAAQLRDRILTITGQRNELETILASMTEGVLAVDSAGHIVSANKAAAQLLNVDPAQIHGRAIEEIIHNVELQRFIRDTLSGGKPTEGDLSFSLEGGRHFHAHAAQLVDPHGRRAGIVIVLSDMTRLRRLEDLRRDFVANVSHELKTPVTSIQGFAEALEAAGANDPEQTRRYLSIIARHAQRLNAIIEDLLSLSRLEDGVERRNISFETAKLKGVLEAALEMSSVKAEEKRMKVVLSCDEDLEARINGPLLEQALLNLLDNAIKYSEPGGAIEVRALAQDSDLAISVKDDGCGIPPEHLSRIFERFYVVDKGRSRKLGGTGLGLAIVKHIAQVHGGYVTVESTPGRGSTFTIHLPCA
jgi:two-component system phosphate regulon sensor histidine kinase PhoR